MIVGLAVFALRAHMVVGVEIDVTVFFAASADEMIVSVLKYCGERLPWFITGIRM